MRYSHPVDTGTNLTNDLPFMILNNVRYIKRQWPIESCTKLLLRPSNRSLRNDLYTIVTLVASIKVLIQVYDA